MAARPGLIGRLWYDAVFVATQTLFTLGFSFRRNGWANVPRDGPALLVSNHQSMLDPMLVGLSDPAPRTEHRASFSSPAGTGPARPRR